MKEIQLSNRLQAVVDLVSKGAKVADIGCDHAYISIYMIEQGIASHVVAMDVNKGPLERATENIREHGLADRIETRLSNGIKELNVGEVNTLLIAGMGGPLMEEILSGKEEVLSEVSELILQPQSEISHVRKFVESIGFELEQEQMLWEDGKSYVMFKCVRKENIQKYGTELFYRYGKSLLEQRNVALLQYIQKEKENAESIMEKLKLHPSQRTQDIMEAWKQTIQFCEEALKYYEG